MKKSILIAIALGSLWQIPAQAQWVEQSSGFPVPGIGVVDIQALSPQVVWAAGLDMTGPSAVIVQFFTRTTNGGSTWMPGTIGGANGFNISSITAVDAQTAWASLYNPPTATGSTSGRIYKTTDSGQTWVHQATAAFATPNGFANKVHFFDAQNGLALGNVTDGYFEFYTTSNGGSQWVRVPAANLPAPLAAERGYINVFSVVGDKVWYGTTRGRVLISSNRGQSWTAAQTGLTRNDPTLPLITNVSFRNDMVGLAQNDSTMRRSTDGGLTWSSISYTGPLHHYDLQHIPGTPATWMSTGANILLNDIGSSVSYDDGLTWFAVDDSVQHTAISFLNDQTGWSGGLNQSASIGGMYRWIGPNALPAAAKDNVLQVYPNPARGEVRLRDLTVGQKVTVQLSDALGRQVWQQVVTDAAGAGEIPLLLPSSAKGLYLLTVQTGEQRLHQKLMLE